MRKFDEDSFFFFQAEDGIRDADVTGVQTCALPIYERPGPERLSVRHRLDLVARVAAAQPAPPHHGAPAPKPGLPLAADPAHLSSLSVRAPGRRHPRWEPDAGIPHVRICAGGAGEPASLPRQDWGGLLST